jgi:UDP-2,4-diacetamido-2,4,6-trideoxy-beta-L-altropyranose hydrolase
MPPVLLLRADAGPTLGVGHVMRCLALAQAWQDHGGAAALVSAPLPEPLAARLRAEGLTLQVLPAAPGEEEDLRRTIGAAREHGAVWVAVDGYTFGPEYLDGLRAAGLRVLVLDDMVHLERYPADMVLNQNLSAAAENYFGRTAPETRLLLGPRFSLLRREFRRTAPRLRAYPPRTRRVLLTMGGADIENLTAAVLDNLRRTAPPGLHVMVLAGAANPQVAALRARAEAMPFVCEVKVNPPNVATLMDWADAAIVAGGSTVWELAALRVPALIGASEDNQLAGLPALASVPHFRAMRAEELLARDLGAELEALWCAPAPVHGPADTEGAVRVVRQLQSAPVTLEPACP